MYGHGVWAITTYYNPSGYVGRRLAFNEFRKRLSVPLLVVEYAGDSAFVLADADADSLVRVRGDTVLWQKERLLNVALAHLPPDARYVAWLDSDVVFTDPLWPQHLEACLKQVPVAQCFSEFIDLAPDEGPDDHLPVPRRPPVPSVGRLLPGGGWPVPNLDPTPNMTARVVGVGFAWAARREILDRHGFYDAMIIGAGDRAMVCAGLGRFAETIGPMALSPERTEHYLAWAQPYYESVRGQIGVLDGLLLHLWHGAIVGRRWMTRQHDLARVGFDPRRDVRIGPGGGWEWTDAASDDLRDLLLRYFEMRNEDGR
jgi:hypothetical protein